MTCRINEFFSLFFIYDLKCDIVQYEKGKAFRFFSRGQKRFLFLRVVIHIPVCQSDFFFQCASAYQEHIFRGIIRKHDLFALNSKNRVWDARKKKRQFVFFFFSFEQGRRKAQRDIVNILKDVTQFIMGIGRTLNWLVVFNFAKIVFDFLQRAKRVRRNIRNRKNGAR